MSEAITNEQRLTKVAIIERFCALSRKVMEAHEHTVAADCFCGHPDSHPNSPADYRFEVMEFIEAAVRDKIIAHKAALEVTK